MKNPVPKKKINYNFEMEKIIENIKKANEKPTLLLHACCGPCSSAVLELLSEIFNITIYYYNPNIHPKKEYERRLEELKKFLTIFPPALANKVKIVVDEYNPEDYFAATNVQNEVELQTEPEKGERCRRCYKFRMEKSYKYACSNNFDFFTTTLSISPHKDSEKINEIGIELAQIANLESNSKLVEQNSFTSDKKICRFFLSDFKKKGGFLRSTQISEEYGLWRQDYCGCVFSMRKDFIFNN